MTTAALGCTSATTASATSTRWSIPSSCVVASLVAPILAVLSSSHPQPPSGTLALPGWLIAWDVFCKIGHRRFARHWSVPDIRHELLDSHGIKLSADAISLYIHRYQYMVAARQQDQNLLHRVYQDIDGVDLTIDGLQPEKGHETLTAVRELKAKRVWFAEALLSSNEAEVRRLLVRAGEMAAQLGKPIRLWMSDKQDAFVKGIAAEFPGIPHRYCGNHFLRDLAKPTLASDSHAKVQMRKKVRGLRAIEREVLQQHQPPSPTPRRWANRPRQRLPWSQPPRHAQGSVEKKRPALLRDLEERYR